MPQGERIGDYVVEAEIGTGGMATVYRARHVHLDTLHALKVLDPRFRTSADVRQRFLDEARIQAKHLRHRNIVRVTNIVATAEHAALVMDLVEGPSLEAMVGQLRQRPDAIRAIMKGVLAGVGHAHASGIVHRDLKPANVLLEQDGGELVPKVTDFGIAKVSAELAGQGKKSTHGAARMGTLHYMSPEQIKSAKDVTPRSDIFSLGAMLYELATGEVPFEGDSDYVVMENIVHGRYVPPERRYDAIDPLLVAVIRTALARDPAHRFATCQEMATALDERAAPPPRRPVAEVTPTPPWQPPPWQPPPQPHRPAAPEPGGPVVLGLVVIAAVAAGGFALWNKFGDSSSSEGDRDSEDGVDVVIHKMERIRDKMCACTDTRCAERAMKELTSLDTGDGKPSKEQMERAMKIAEEMSECQKKLMTAAEATTP